MPPTHYYRALLLLLAIATSQCIAADDKVSSPTQQPWMDTSLSADARTQLLLKEMTLDEKLSLVFGYFGNNATWKNSIRPPESHPQSAGFVYGVPRLGIQHIWMADAGLGVASQGGPEIRERTALASGLSTAASWNPALGYKAGAMIGSEARTSGFNVLLAGSVNLVREPRNGRNFEYAGEDPWLAGNIVGQQIKGVQSNHLVSTLKHFAYNDQETGRNQLNVIIDDDAGRMSDLLALQIANEIGEPGSVMCSYNRVNGFYSCEDDYLLNQLLKKEWGFKGWVMSDWGATHSTVPAANNGLDQQSGYPFDQSAYFKEPLKEAVMNGWVSPARLDDMVGRILYSMFNLGVIDHPVSAPSNDIDFKGHAAITQEGAEEGAVLLKNQKLLPITPGTKKIAVIGGHADVGVLSGGGSSQVYPRGGIAVKGLEPSTWPGPVIYFPSSPLKALKSRLPKSTFTYLDGTNLAAATKLAAKSDLVIVFATQWIGEANDARNLSLPDNQDALIAALANTNPNTLVVLETGGPVLMPWLDSVGAVLEAWYPGTRGGDAIARILVGEVNPSGHLPITFPAAEAQLPRPVLDGDPSKPDDRFDVNYHEGAAVGYKWFELKNLKPLFPFGHGLSYTEFSYTQLTSSLNNGNLSVSFRVKNTGTLVGKDVAQIYVAPLSTHWEAPKRLVGFQKVDLAPGESTLVTLTIDPRLLAMYKDHTWNIAAGEYQILLAKSSIDIQAKQTLKLPQKTLAY